MIERKTQKQVQEAVRTTVLGLLGSLPRHAFETTAIATGDALANLMFQLQMTGYMFKNAEYRLSLQSSMRASAALPPGENAYAAHSSTFLSFLLSWYCTRTSKITQGSGYNQAVASRLCMDWRGPPVLS